MNSAITNSEFTQRLESAWAELNSCLAALNESQMTDIYDDQGWNIKDHITHLAAWEESMVMLFQGKPRHQTLVVDPEKFSSEYIDEINSAVRDRLKHLSIKSAIEEFHSIHTRLMASVKGLSEADLNQSVILYFPQSSPNDKRRVFEIIEDNTNGHYLEHLVWIKEISRLEEKHDPG